MCLCLGSHFTTSPSQSTQKQSHCFTADKSAGPPPLRSSHVQVTSTLPSGHGCDDYGSEASLQSLLTPDTENRRCGNEISRDLLNDTELATRTDQTQFNGSYATRWHQTAAELQQQHSDQESAALSSPSLLPDSRGRHSMAEKNSQGAPHPIGSYLCMSLCCVLSLIHI